MKQYKRGIEAYKSVSTETRKVIDQIEISASNHNTGWEARHGMTVSSLTQ